jgi:hypothetical protein
MEIPDKIKRFAFSLRLVYILLGCFGEVGSVASEPEGLLPTCPGHGPNGGLIDERRLSASVSGHRDVKEKVSVVRSELIAEG